MVFLSMLEVKEGCMADWVCIDECCDVGGFADKLVVDGDVMDKTDLGAVVIFVVFVVELLEECFKVLGVVTWKGSHVGEGNV